MKSLTTIFFSLITLFVIAQTDSTLVNQVEYLRVNNKYNQIINLLNQENKNNPNDLWINYQLACFYSLTEDTVNAFKYLYKAIEYGADGKNILTDSDFENIHQCTEWETMVRKLENIYLSENPNISHKNMAIKLWHIYIEDQRYRTLGKNNKKPKLDYNSKEFKQKNKEVKKYIKKTRKYLFKLIKENGWITYSMVGKTAADGLFLFFQHSTIKDMKRILPLIKEAAYKNETSKENYALMFDRVMVHTENQQYYGTQITSPIVKSYEEFAKLTKDDYYFVNIKDYENVNKRRKEMGMGTIEEYAKKMGVKLRFEE